LSVKSLTHEIHHLRLFIESSEQLNRLQKIQLLARLIDTQSSGA